jgi:hypothetical protein
MKRASKTKTSDGMRKEYDFSNAEIGKYARRYAAGTNVVVLDSDVAEVFPNSKSVNDALRSLARTRRPAQGRPTSTIPGGLKTTQGSGRQSSRLR